jgi:chromosome segregation ATPase
LRKSSEEREQALRQELSAVRAELSSTSVQLSEHQLAVQGNRDELKQQRTQLQEECARSERLARLLKHSKEERLAVASRMEMLEKRMGAARTPLPTPQLNEGRALAMLRELRAEEQVLNERLVARTYQVKEFRARLTDATESLQSAQKQAAASLQQVEEERRRGTTAESALLRTRAQVTTLTRETEDLRAECVRLRKAVRVAETQTQVANESIRTAEKQAALFEAQVVASEVGSVCMCVCVSIPKLRFLSPHSPCLSSVRF